MDRAIETEQPRRVDDLASMLAEGVAHHQAGRLETAGDLYRRILAMDSKNAAALHLCGVIEAHSGRLGEAIEFYEQALRIQPNFPEVLNNLAIVLKRQGRLSEAIGLYERALRLKPDYLDALANLGNALRAEGRLSEAIARYQQALRLKPGHLAALKNLADARHDQGRFDEAAGLYRQVIDLKQDDDQAHNNLGIVLKKQGRLDEAIGHYLKALRLNPGGLDALHNLGVALQARGEPDAAISRFEQVLRLKPDHLEALNNLGLALQQQGRLDEAICRYEDALRLKPDFPGALINLANALEGQDRLDEAILRYEQALHVQPDFADALVCLGNVLRAQGKMDGAMEHYRQALRLQPDHVEAHWNDGCTRLLLGDFGAGWRSYEWRWRNKNASPHGHAQALWDGARLDGKTILLHCEQGLGDSIQFIRYARLVKDQGGTVVVFCPERLARLFQGVAGIDQLVTDRARIPPCHCQAPLLSLPMLLRTTLATIPADVPYLRPEPDLVALWRTRLTPLGGVKVGVVWQGRPNYQNDRKRSIAVDLFAGLFAVPGCSFVSLQKELKEGDGAALRRYPNLVEIAADLQDFADTAAVIANLDLVVTVDTAVAHLTGALGRPGFVLLPFVPDWRWLLGREDTPWYPSIRLFRQAAAGDWSGVLERVASALRTLAVGDASALVPAKAIEHQPEDGHDTAVPSGPTDYRRWSDPARLDPAWDARARRVADYIPAGAAVLDLGCGAMALERFLPDGCLYIPCDLVRRDHRTVVCDINAGQYPGAAAARADVVTVLGVLEYAADPQAFLRCLRQWQRPIVLSYCPTDAIPDRERRRALGWITHYSRADLTALLARVGLKIVREDAIDPVQVLFKLVPEFRKSPTVPKPKQVAVVSYFNAPNFGDRLGYHLINALLPPHAVVTHLPLKPWRPEAGAFDLVIVGLGNSLFGSLINRDLLSLVEHSRAAIGIFGTQYHESMPRQMLGDLVSRLDHWYARHGEDVLRYGRGHDNVEHLGDWLVTAFPMARATDPRKLVIEDAALMTYPLDRTIQEIQTYRQVFSPRLHPLLCALTSADTVGYREQSGYGIGSSGKFRGMLIDIFGRTFPEEEMWPVDRAMVAAYKAAVGQRVEDMRRRILRLLSDDG